MNRLSVITMGLLVIGLTVLGCAYMSFGQSDPGWTTLIDGATGLDNWNRVGDANWRAEDGAIVADKGKGGYLVSKNSYKDFQIRAEFWADHTTNSGVFIRCQDPKKVGADSSYEVNIWDKRPDPTYGTGAIVNFAAVTQPYVKSANRWNVFEIVARGNRVVVTLNGHQTVDMINGKFSGGPFALQSAGGTIRFRKVEIRAL